MSEEPRIDEQGWLTGVRRCLSPNADARPPDSAVELVVLHHISLPPGEFGSAAIEQFFTNRLDVAAHPYYRCIADLRVSAHGVIRRDGEVVQFVSCDERAWHAGASCWRGRSRCNDFSVGIELEGCDTQPFTDAQYAAVVQCLRALLRRYPILGIAGHEHIAPGRKTDPGPTWDWSRLMQTLSLPAHMWLV